MSFKKRTIRDIPVDGRTILVRTDFNVPFDEKGDISDDFRIRASLPTIKYLLKRGCKVVIISHLGRPDGVKNPKFSLEKPASRLARLLGRPVRFVDDVKGERVYQAVRVAPKNSVIVLENLRFYSEEEANDSNFAKEVARSSRAEYFVQDGFGAAHRAHASTAAITQFLPSVAGLLLEKEYRFLSQITENPARPFVSILGGAKVSDKIQVVEKLAQKSDGVLVGGAMANTFLANIGVSVGSSKVEDGQKQTVENILNIAKKSGGEFILPKDVAVGESTASDSRRVYSIHEIPDGELALDIGDKTIDKFCDKIKNAKTVFWNGPMGYSENSVFSHGSARIALTLASNPQIVSIIGGGDTADFAHKWAGDGKMPFSHISTGGGAGLDLIAGKKLPGIENLLD